MSVFKELYDYRQMILSLVKKDLRGRYKGSVLGFLWTFINPLFQLIIYTIVFSTILKSDIDKYYLFLFVALIPWIFFSSALTGGASSVLAQQSMVTKIYFPREVLPISYVTSSFVNMIYCFIIVFIIVFISGTKINFTAILFLPVVMIIEYFLALGIALVSSSVTVYFRDCEHILGIVSMGWMYLTPIMYSVEIVPDEYRNLFYFNPMTSIITAYRDILYYSKIPDMETLTNAVILAVLFMTAGMFVFGKLKKHFAEEL